MRKFIIILILICSVQSIFAQEKNFIDQPYLETTALVDSFVTPDLIYISIALDEGDSRNKKSTEELENDLEEVLKSLQIDTEKDLTLLDYTSSFKKYFLKGQAILKTKNYSLKVHDAVTAGKVLSALEQVGISNVLIEKLAYSNEHDLILSLRYMATSLAKENAVKLANGLGQNIGKAIYISDNNTVTNAVRGRDTRILLRGIASLHGSSAPEPILTDFQKIKYETQVVVKFTLN